MIDLDSAAALTRAAQKAHQMLTAQIQADPHGPIVADLQRIADMAQAIVRSNAQLITSLESRTR